MQSKETPKSFQEILEVKTTSIVVIRLYLSIRDKNTHTYISEVQALVLALEISAGISLSMCQIYFES